MSVDINIKFSADERLLESMDLLSSWLAAVYAEMKKHPAVPAPPAKVFPLIRKGSTQEEPQEPAPKPSAEPSADAPKEKPPEEKPTVATPDAESKTEPPAQSPELSKEEVRKLITAFIGKPGDPEHDERAEVLKNWLAERSLQVVWDADETQMQDFIALVESKLKEVKANA